MNETVRMVGCRRDWTQTALRMLVLQGEREAENGKVHPLLKDEALIGT